jgi:hypothetical protein
MSTLTIEGQIAWYAQRQGYPKSAVVTYNDQQKCYVLKTKTQQVYCGRNFQEATHWLSKRHR